MCEPPSTSHGVEPPSASPPSRQKPARAGRVALASIGCRANREEMECLRSRLVDAGWEVVPFGAQADWVVVNTCTVTSGGDADSRRTIRRAARGSPEAGLVVTGCLAQRSPEELAALPGVTHVLGNAEKPGLLGWIRARGKSAGAAVVRVSPDPTTNEFPAHGESRPTGRERRALKVQDGCDARCTYCVIPSVRGASRSRPLEDCREQARRLAAGGGREIVLTGINLSLWGRDLPGRPELPDLVESLACEPGVARIRLSSLEPQALTSRWLDRLLGAAALCRHFHLPLQSGDAGVLRRMGRPYGPELCALRVEEIRRRASDASIGADILVGFPGETDAAFERTEALLRRLSLSYLHVFAYSPRPGTAALRLGPPPLPEVARARSRRLRELSRALRERFARQQLGRTAEVLAERRLPDGRWEGTSDNYLRVRFGWTEGDPRAAGPIAIRLRTIDPEGRLVGEAASPPGGAFAPAAVDRGGAPA